MPSEYSVWLQQSVCEFLNTVDENDRERLLDWLNRLGRRPNQGGDFVERRERRDCQVAVYASYSITWWIDYAVCEVRVMEIGLADL